MTIKLKADRHPDLHVVRDAGAGVVVMILRSKLGLVVKSPSIRDVPNKTFLISKLKSLQFPYTNTGSYLDLVK